MPGGFGTLDEAFEVGTLIQTGKLERFPIVALGGAPWFGGRTSVPQFSCTDIWGNTWHRVKGMSQGGEVCKAVLEDWADLDDLQLPDPAQRDRDVGLESAPLADLLDSQEPEARAELQWRFSPAIAVVVLALLAIPLSHSAPREGRGGRVALGIGAILAFLRLIYGAGYQYAFCKTGTPMDSSDDAMGPPSTTAATCDPRSTNPTVSSRIAARETLVSTEITLARQMITSAHASPATSRNAIGGRSR